jgi:CheY-like chemotaxis protein
MPEPKPQRTILVIEDEAMLREITEDMLTASGYRVICAPDGPEAIDRFEKNGSIDLVLSDLGLPGMSGEEVVKRLLAIRPGTKIIVCSGYVDPGLTAQLSGMGVQILAKPYRSNELLRAVETAIGA